MSDSIKHFVSTYNKKFRSSSLKHWSCIYSLYYHISEEYESICFSFFSNSDKAIDNLLPIHLIVGDNEKCIGFICSDKSVKNALTDSYLKGDDNKLSVCSIAVKILNELQKFTNISNDWIKLGKILNPYNNENHAQQLAVCY